MTSSIMAQEAKQTPEVIDKQLRANAAICQALGKRIREFAPHLVCIVGRGSSDHAGVFAKYLVEVELGVPVCAAAPSVKSIYQQNLKLDSALVLIISQSGRSPDILAQAESAKNAGALTVALVNDVSSPLAQIVDVVLPLGAGAERAVAATKSYLATLSALLQMVAHWKNDTSMIDALDSLPSLLTKVVEDPAQLSAKFVSPLAHCVVLGRGFGYAISREIALKMKEVCGVHAEAFSSAEFLHGPVTLVEKQLAVVDIQIEDESFAAHCELISDINSRGATSTQLSNSHAAGSERFLPLAILQRFYLDIEQIAVSMGLDPDNPVGLKKVTRTL